MMVNPMTLTLQAQAMAIQGALGMLGAVNDGCARMLDQQARLLQAQGLRRAEDEHLHFCPTCGADLMDHYGRRCHDVDVERI